MENIGLKNNAWLLFNKTKRKGLNEKCKLY